MPGLGPNLRSETDFSFKDSKKLLTGKNKEIIKGNEKDTSDDFIIKTRNKKKDKEKSINNIED